MKRGPLYLTALVVVIFFVKVLSFMTVECDKACRDIDSESNSIMAAQIWVKQGIASTYGIAIYPNFVQETPINKLREMRAYTHYFAGPDYVLYGIFSIFGDSPTVILWGRLIPVFLVLSGLWFFTRQVLLLVKPRWEWCAPIIFAAVLLAPQVYQMVVTYHGLSYMTALIFFAFGVGLHPRLSVSKKMFFSFLLGFLSHHFNLTGTFVVFAAPAVGTLFLGGKDIYKTAVRLSFFVGLGMVSAFVLHFAQLSALVGWKDAWVDQFGTAVNRGTWNEPPSRLQLIGIYSRLVNGGFRIGSIAMLASGLFFIWLIRDQKFEKRRYSLGLIAAFVASYTWILLMKKHSVIHQHLNPMTFVFLFAAWLVILCQLVSDRALKKG